MFCSGSSWPRPIPCHPLFPPSFRCFNHVPGACSSYYVGAYGWVAGICQPREQSKSWLPTVEAPGCLRHPIIAMQLLTFICVVANGMQ